MTIVRRLLRLVTGRGIDRCWACGAENPYVKNIFVCSVCTSPRFRPEAESLSAARSTFDRTVTPADLGFGFPTHQILVRPGESSNASRLAECFQSCPWVATHDVLVGQLSFVLRTSLRTGPSQCVLADLFAQPLVRAIGYCTYPDVVGGGRPWPRNVLPRFETGGHTDDELQSLTRYLLNQSCPAALISREAADRMDVLVQAGSRFRVVIEQLEG